MIHFVLIGIFFKIDGLSWKIFILVIGSQIYRLNEILSGTDIKFGFKIFFQQTWRQQLIFLFSLGLNVLLDILLLPIAVTEGVAFIADCDH